MVTSAPVAVPSAAGAASRGALGPARRASRVDLLRAVTAE